MTSALLPLGSADLLLPQKGVAEKLAEFKSWGMQIETDKDLGKLEAPTMDKQRMDWLYLKAAEDGETYNFGNLAKEWLMDRVCAADLSARKNKRPSIWWQYAAKDKSREAKGTGSTRGSGNVEKTVGDKDDAAVHAAIANSPSGHLVPPISPRPVAMPRASVAVVLSQGTGMQQGINLLTEFNGADDEDEEGENKEKKENKDQAEGGTDRLAAAAANLSLSDSAASTASTSSLSSSSSPTSSSSTAVPSSPAPVAREPEDDDDDCDLDGSAVAAAMRAQQRGIRPLRQLKDWRTIAATSCPNFPTSMAGLRNKAKPPGWKNSGQWRSVGVEIIELRGGNGIGGPGGSASSPSQYSLAAAQLPEGQEPTECIQPAMKKWYTVVRVDSASLRSRESYGLIRDHFEFPLREHTQYIDTAVYRAGAPGAEGELLGHVLISLHDVIKGTEGEVKIQPYVPGLERRDGPFSASPINASASPAPPPNPNEINGPVVLERRIWLPLTPCLPDGSPLGAAGSMGSGTGHLIAAALTVEVNVAITLSPNAAKEDTTHTQVMHTGQSSAMTDRVRGAVSKKKRRFQQDGFDLDLAYVTDQIIAMGYPSEGTEAMYRNDMRDVLRFFAKRHPASFRVYNLCSERHYDTAKFEGSAVRFPFDDHNPCPMELTKHLCEDMRQWLTAHPQHVAAIHCKAGKGRTGTVIAMYLIYAGICKTANEALDYFSKQRTKDSKGVTIPSQMRFVYYFEAYCRLKRLGLQQPGPTTLFVHAIVIHNLPGFKAADVFCVIKQADKRWRSNDKRPDIGPTVNPAKGTVIWEMKQKTLAISEDVKFEFYHKTALKTKKLFHFHVNTRFQPLVYAPHRDATAEDEEEESEEDDEENPAERQKKPSKPKADQKPMQGPAGGAGGDDDTDEESDDEEDEDEPKERKQQPDGAQAPKAKSDKKQPTPAQLYCSAPPPWPETVVHPWNPRFLLWKNQLDGAIKDKKHKRFLPNLQVEVVISRTDILRVKDRELNAPLGLSWQGQLNFGGDRPLVAGPAAAAPIAPVTVAATPASEPVSQEPPPLNAQLSIMMSKRSNDPPPA